MNMFNLALKYNLFEGYDYGDCKVIEDDLNDALDAQSLQEALEILDLADIPVSKEMLYELTEFYNSEIK